MMGKLDKLDIALIAASLLMIGMAAGVALCKFVPGFWRLVL